MIRKLFVAAVFCMPVIAFAQDPVTQRGNGQTPQVQEAPKQKAAPLAGSVWSGKETINNNGKLAFIFKKDGKAVMIDANSTVNGTWTSQGDKVAIRFQNCVYDGKVQGRMMTGSAVVTEGPQTGATWNFAVEHQDPYRNREFNGNEKLDGFGALTFRFGDNFNVEMIDAKTRVQGRYTMDLDTVTIHFANCVYVGRLQGDRVTGLARYTTSNPGEPWEFEVSVKK